MALIKLIKLLLKFKELEKDEVIGIDKDKNVWKITKKINEGRIEREKKYWFGRRFFYKRRFLQSCLCCSTNICFHLNFVPLTFRLFVHWHEGEVKGRPQQKELIRPRSCYFTIDLKYIGWLFEFPDKKGSKFKTLFVFGIPFLRYYPI